MSLYAVLISLDILSATLGFLIAGQIRLGSALEHQAVLTLGVVLPTFIAISLNNGAYSLRALQDPAAGAKKAVEALCFGIAVAIGLLFFLKVSIQFPRTVFAMGAVLSLVFTVAARLLVGKRVGAAHDWTFANEVLIVDGLSARPLGAARTLDAEKLGLQPRMSDPLSLHRLGQMLERCDRVILAASEERRADWVAALKGTGIEVEVLATELAAIGPLALNRYGAAPTLVVSAKPLGFADSIRKRTLDLAVSFFALLFLAPLLVLVAVAIKLDSRGPIFFRQARIGQGNRIFHVFKFRTMRTELTDPNGCCQTVRGDVRVTRLGAILRRTSIDELPQLLNVILGDMSLVGPRPHALESKAGNHLFWDVHPAYWSRAAVKPGLTGLAQVRGYRGPTETHKHLIDRVDSDLEYVSGWSVWRDIAIICATFSVLAHPNAI